MNKALVRVYIRGALAVIALGSVPALMLGGQAIPNEWGMLTATIIAFYFGQDSVQGNSE